MNRYFTRDPFFDEQDAIASIKQWAYPLLAKSDLQPLFNHIGDARIVLLGESSHGTHEYYTWRTYITQKLIEEKGFDFIAVEGDWPDCYKVNRYIKGYDTTSNSITNVLHDFNRWPTWLWANREIIELSKWLIKYNEDKYINDKVGFYGLDVYSLWESMANILSYLNVTDKEAWKIANRAFQCFEPYRSEEGVVHYQASSKLPSLCESAVLQMLEKIRQKLPTYNTDHENVFNAEQNALVAVNAERYYRNILKGNTHSWNVRDRHMADTLDRLLNFHGNTSKAIIWEHNTHIGDARATDMIDNGMLNVGELLRTRHPEKGVVLVGFGSYQGSVVAAPKWKAGMQVINMPPAQKGSWEYLLHSAGKENKLLLMDDFTENSQLMENHVGHRAIGVVYDPAFEQFRNYVPSILPLRYDAFIYLDTTTALHPLHMPADISQVAETYPFGV